MTPELDSAAHWIIGDAAVAMRELPTAHARLVMTSPPFLQLRSYLADDDPMAEFEVGWESTPGEYLDRLLTVTDEAYRVLDARGTLAIEIGDSLSGAGGTSGDLRPGGLRAGQIEREGTLGALRRDAKQEWVSRDDRPGWPLAKSLVCIPSLIQVALAYGINPLTGIEHRKWRVRNKVVWIKTRPAPGRMGDKWKPATSYLIVAAKSKDRVWHPHKGADKDHWTLTSSQAPGEHYATFPVALAQRVIEACTDYGDVVLDPYAGIGSTLRAAVDVGRRALGIDLDARNYEVALRRMGLTGLSLTDLRSSASP
jgi:DNA modification methylase